MYKDFRDYLSALEGKGKLKRITVEVDKDWELSTIARTVTTMAAPQRYGLLFENVKGYKTPVSARRTFSKIKISIWRSFRYRPGHPKRTRLPL